MSAKMGRPTENPRNIQVRVRLNEDEAAMLAVCAEQLQISKTAVIVRGIKQVYSEIKK
ncbi:hypothetical protein [uncultured Megasphaera sp.]|uniref:hypothetical protein n=1 Tax=uncultured Megasphaera sp. TaxID=165188 RepID=UPI00265D16E9|nr:hypothetical protein [uncultured Megasphaera sp.]